jgi:hypothetical protein
MERITYRRRSTVLISAMVVAIMAAACGGSPTSTAPAPTPAAAAAPTREPLTVPTSAPPTATATKASPTATPTPQPTQVPINTPTPKVAALSALSTNGPWLVYNTDHGVFAANADGTGRLLLTDTVPLRNDLPEGTSSSGGWLALRTGDNPMEGTPARSQTLMLSLLHLPDGQFKTITPLFSPEIDKAIQDAQGDRTDAVEAGIAIAFNRDTMSWSPDGRYLAFIAAIDGPSSDLYSYDIQTGQINRLTDGPNQAATLSWSTDSKWIVHQEVENFGTGAGWSVKAMWAAAPDGNNTKKLYDAPETSGGENVIGWTAPDTFIVYTWGADHPKDARAVNVNTGEATPIDLDVVKSGLWNDMVWSPAAERFYVTPFEGGIASVALDNQVTHFEGESLQPSISPDGKFLAFWGNSAYGPRDGVRVYSPNGNLIREVTTDPADFVTWRPDGQGLFYVSDASLSYVPLPDGQPTPIDEGVQVSAEGGVGWVR